MGPTNPSEEHFKGGLWGWATSVWVKLVATAGGLLKIQIGGQDADVEVKQQTPGDLMPGIQGWDGAAWRKLPIIWGYSERYAEVVVGDNLAAGTHGLDFSTVPAGEVWVVTSVVAYCLQSNVTRIEFAMFDGVNYYQFKRTAPSAPNFTVEYRGPIYLQAGDKMYCMFIDCAFMDDVRASAIGYKMKVEE